MNKSINELTKEEFTKEFDRLMPAIPKEKQLPKHLFLSMLFQKGILKENKLLEFLQ